MMMTDKQSVTKEEKHASAGMQEARMYLRRVRDAYRRSIALSAQLERYRELATRATGRMDALRVSGTSQRSKVETYVLELVEAQAKIEEEIHHLLEWTQEAEALIAQLEDSRMQDVLRMRYLCALDWEEVAQRQHYTLRWVHKLHREALAQLEGAR